MSKGRKPMRAGAFLALTVVPMALVVLLALVVTYANVRLFPTVAAFFGEGEQTAVAPEGTAGWNSTYYDEPYASSEEAKEASYAVAHEAMREGAVLLANDGTLPLDQGSEVVPYGYAALHPVYGQSSSGGSAKWDDDPVTPVEGLSSHFAVNESVLEAMRAAPEPEPLKEAPGTLEAGKAGSALGGNSSIFEYPLSVFEGIVAPDATAVVFISRSGQEGMDKKWDGYIDGTPHYLALSQNEKDMIAAAKESCGSVVVVLVASQPMQVPELISGELSANAVLWIGNPGEVGMAELGALLSGEVNPSGRTVDIWPSDFTADPTYQNIGSFSYSNATVESHALQNETGSISRYFTDYQEGVYVGYRYYETAGLVDPEFSYGDAVVFPFGYGLSYTTFERRIVGLDSSDGKVSVRVEVSNTGDVAGRDVVELYYSAPYTSEDALNKVEKPACVLAAFDKTKLLEPGETQEILLSFAVEDMASYSYTHQNPDGTLGCYVLSAGDYEVSLRSDSHTVLDTRIVGVPETICYDGSNEDHIRLSEKAAQSTLDEQGVPTNVPAAGSYVAATNRFQVSSDYMNEESTILSRAAWDKTQPQTMVGRTKELGEKYVGLLGADTTFDVWTDPTYGNIEGSEAYRSEPPASGQDNGLTLASMRGLDYNDPLWDSYLDQIDWSERTQIEQNFAGAAYRLGGIDSLGMPQTKIEDGANGIKVEAGIQSVYDMSASASFPFAPVMASSWDTELLYKVGAALGQEALMHGVTGWYCPAINLHRSPFSGRVFEYYSEDPLLSGKLAAAAISGAGDNGLYVTLKHFALNDTETNRGNLMCVWADEQTMRELYLRAFEIAVKDARMTVRYTADDQGTVAERTMRACTGIMPSQAAVGTRLGEVNPDLLQGVLRGEWGFRGTVYTDYWVWMDDDFRDLCLRTGSDAYLCMYVPALFCLEDYESPSAQWAMREALHNISYTLANSNATQGAVPGTRYATAVPMCRIVLVAVNVALFAAVGAYVWRVVVRFRRQRKVR